MLAGLTDGEVHWACLDLPERQQGIPVSQCCLRSPGRAWEQEWQLEFGGATSAGEERQALSRGVALPAGKGVGAHSERWSETKSGSSVLR
jgi:hypothetical protein